jgi:hypothetical protein
MKKASMCISSEGRKKLDRKKQEDEQNHIMQSVKVGIVSTLGQLGQVPGTCVGTPFVLLDSSCWAE